MSSMGDYRFKRSVMGYDTAQVEEEIRKLEAEFQNREREAQEKLQQSEATLEKVKRELGATQDQLNDFRKRERGILDILARAEMQASNIEENARGEASRILESVQNQVEEKRRELVALEQRYEAFKQEFMQTVKRYGDSLGLDSFVSREENRAAQSEVSALEKTAEPVPAARAEMAADVTLNEAVEEVELSLQRFLPPIVS